jgi:hypothetical protein
LKKKGQISLFVIIGLVLLIVFFLLLSLRNKSSPSDDVSTVSYELESGALKDHISSCISRVASDALEKIGENGGFIYDFQGGKIPFNDLSLGDDYLPFIFQGRNYNVAYGLKKNTACPLVSYAVPDYPISGVSFSDFNLRYNSNKNCLLSSPPHSAYDGFFGSVTLAKLCYSARASSCEDFATGSVMGFSVQRQLEDYVSSNLPLCVNFSSFSNRLNANISSDAPPSVLVEVHNSDILFSVSYPVSIVFEGRKPVVVVADYQVPIAVRFGAFYNFIFNVLSFDSKKPNFDLLSHYVSSSFWRQGFSVKKIPFACKTCSPPYSSDSLFEFSDAKSLVNGHPFIFRLFVENRRPAIDFISDRSYVLGSSGSDGFNLKISAFDPDDSKLDYYFLSQGLSGWLENSGSNYQRILLDLNSLPSSLSLPLTSLDVGSHKVGVLAVDESGFFDYQWFTLNVSSGSVFPADSSCISDCLLDSSNSDSCLVSVNQCSSGDANCLGDWWISSDPLDPTEYFEKPDCNSCVEMVLGYSEDEIFSNCKIINSYDSCKNRMPDCFWVNESLSLVPPFSFKEHCVNDFDLSSLKMPSYIIR